MRRLQRRRRRLGAAEHAEQVGLQQQRPQFFRDQIELRRRDAPARARGPGVVHQQVEPAKLVHRCQHHPFGLAGLAHVAGRTDRLATGIDQPGHRLRPARIVGQVVHRDGGAEAGQHLGRREADARRAAGHQRGLAFQVVADHVPSIGPILRSACFSASSLRSRSRNNSSGLRSPQSKYPLPDITPVRPWAISASNASLRPRGSGGV